MRLVLIEWIDAFGCSSEWQEIGDLSPELPTCRSVGWLAHDGDDCKVIVPHLSEPQEGVTRQGCGDMTIPTCAIQRILDLTESQPVTPAGSVSV